MVRLGNIIMKVCVSDEENTEEVYISCKPTSLARDLVVFEQNGYHMERMCNVDMFPETVHVETVCLLINQNVKHHVKIGIDVEDYRNLKNL